MPEAFHRRDLPHWYMPAASHFVTFRLAGTLPKAVHEELRIERERVLAHQPPDLSVAEHRERVHKQFFVKYDDLLANDRGIVWLADPRLAALVRKSLYHLNGNMYGLLAYSIMPNHVHMLIRPFDRQAPTASELEAYKPGETDDSNSPLSKIMHSLKGFTAHEGNKILRRSGQFWQHESYDHWVRDEIELERIVAYINANAVKAGLAALAHEYCWCSAHDRYLYDGAKSGWLAYDAI